MEGARLVEERKEEERKKKGEECGTILDALRRYEKLAHRHRKKNKAKK